MAQARQVTALHGVRVGFAAPSPAVAFAIRFAVCVSIAIWLGHAPALVTNNASWILITVLMVAQPDTGGSLLKGLLRALGTAAAAVTAIVLFGFFSQDPPLLLAAVFLTQAVGAYGFSGPRNQYAWFVFAFTTVIILGDPMTGSGPVETVAFQRATMVGLGLLIVFVMDTLLWPASTASNVRADLAARARGLATSLGEAITAPAAAGTTTATSPASPLTAQLGQIDAARAEIGVIAMRTDILRRVAILLEAVASRARILQQPIESGGAPTAADDTLAQPLRTFADQVEAALEEVAAALDAGRVPAPVLDGLNAAFLPLQSELERLREQGAARSALQGRMASLRNLVDLLDTLQRAFDGLATAPIERGTALTAARITERLRPDPFRMQIALRTGIAVCVALLIPMTFGWSLNTTVAPIAFMLAAVPTRGGAAQTVLMLVVVLCVGWLLADLAIVFVGPQLDRMPLALVHVAAVAGTLGYVSVKQPKLAIMRSVGGLLALLTVYGGPMAATDVYGPYSTTCYIALAVAVGWAATQLFWPATAAKLFRVRAAAQIDLCLSALRGLAPGCDRAEQRRHAARILQRYTGQLASMAGLHGQAEHEPVELDLDGSRRAALLALTQDLFDASLANRDRAAWAGEPEPGPSRPGLASLREALLREDAALFASLQSAANALRRRATVVGTPAAPGAALAQAQRAVLDCLDTLGDDAGDATFLEQLDTRRRVVTRQLALEAWIADWAAAGAGHLAPAEP